MLLIADSGSTKTDWLVTNSDGPARLIQTDGFNPYYQTTGQITAALQEQLLPGLAGVETSITDIFFYGAGCSGPSVNYIVSDAIQRVLPDAQTIAVNSDMLGAARSAAGHEPGIVCILGTGSNACQYDGEQIIQGIQSLGFWLGDEGSGGYLGKTLVRDFFQNRLPLELQDAFQKKYVLDRPTLLEHAYRKPYPNRYFAGFTPFLSEHIAYPFIRQLVFDAFVLFLTTYVVRWPAARQLPVHFAGSIAYYFQEVLRSAVLATGLTMGRIVRSPIDWLAAYHRVG